MGQQSDQPTSLRPASSALAPSRDLPRLPQELPLRFGLGCSRVCTMMTKTYLTLASHHLDEPWCFGCGTYNLQNAMSFGKGLQSSATSRWRALCPKVRWAKGSARSATIQSVLLGDYVGIKLVYVCGCVCCFNPCCMQTLGLAFCHLLLVTVQAEAELPVLLVGDKHGVVHKEGSHGVQRLHSISFVC